jgi:4-amino-4-deoxychorismate lyase
VLIAMLNGRLVAPHDAVIPMNDRGLLYGDGLFETMRLSNGQVQFIDDHLQRLADGCKRLKIDVPDMTLLHYELQKLVGNHRDAVLKLVVTRGGGGRGYRPPVDAQPLRLWQLFAPVSNDTQPLTVRWCETRLARNALFAGMKHLNRLEQVMAQSEWNDAQIGEGLLTDTEGELICGTMSNVFLMVDGTMVTPDLRYCGVAGIMRKNILKTADELNLAVEVRAVRFEELYSASEVFVTNVVRGIRSVVTLLPSQFRDQQRDGYEWQSNEVATQIKHKLSELTNH